jgi:hypothetical protein
MDNRPALSLYEKARFRITHDTSSGPLPAELGFTDYYRLEMVMEVGGWTVGPSD